MAAVRAATTFVRGCTGVGRASPFSFSREGARVLRRGARLNKNIRFFRIIVISIYKDGSKEIFVVWLHIYDDDFKNRRYILKFLYCYYMLKYNHDFKGIMSYVNFHDIQSQFF